MNKDEWYLKLEKWAFDDDRLHRLPLALLRPLAEHLAEADEKNVDWEARAVLEAKRVFANGERATAAEYALRYVIEKLQHHHTSRPGISEIIKSAKRLYKDSGGTTLFAPDKSGDSVAQAEPVKSSNPPVESAPL